MYTLDTVLVAAHPDDELLGGYDVILPELSAGRSVGVIFAPVESRARMLMEGRYRESAALAAELGYRVWTPGELPNWLPSRVLVPHPTDDHPEHRHAQAWGLEYASRGLLPRAVEFYSIQKRHFDRRPRAADVERAVRTLFAAHFKTQAALVQDPVYFLFSGVSLVEETIEVCGGAWGHGLLSVRVHAALRADAEAFFAALPVESPAVVPDTHGLLALAMRLRARVAAASPAYVAAPITVRVYDTVTREVVL